MKNHCLIVDFVQAAQINGLVNIWANLPASHYLIKSNQVKQIRKVTDCVAMGFDDLGNRVRLTPDCRVIQDI
jgi:hypothetical protein